MTGIKSFSTTSRHHQHFAILQYIGIVLENCYRYTASEWVDAEGCFLCYPHSPNPAPIRFAMTVTGVAYRPPADQPDTPSTTGFERQAIHVKQRRYLSINTGNLGGGAAEKIAIIQNQRLLFGITSFDINASQPLTHACHTGPTLRIERTNNRPYFNTFTLKPSLAINYSWRALSHYLSRLPWQTQTPLILQAVIPPKPVHTRLSLSLPTAMWN